MRISCQIGKACAHFGGVVLKNWAKVPQREELLASRWMQPFARHLSSPLIWRMNRRGIARGIALGLFAAFAMPVAQTPFAAALAVGARANLPVAAAAAFVTNPITVPFLYPLAYLLGAQMLHMRENSVFAIAPDADMFERIMGWIMNLAGPTYVGLLVFASASAAIGYFTVHYGWSLRVRHKRRTRLARPAAQPEIA